MPLYEYKCEQCGSRTEALQKLSDPPLTKCVYCGGKLRKVISPPAIQFKGSGWYITDYSKKHIPDNGPSSKEATEKPSKEVKPADTKPADTKPAEKS